MKKLFIVFLLVGTIIQESQAKIQGGIGVSVGPAFGRQNNEFKSGKLNSAGGALGFQTGVHAAINGRIWFNKFVGLNLSPEFNMTGSTYTVTEGTRVTKQTHKENQLTIPVTAMVGWGNERLRFFANVGGYFGYNINGKDILEINNNGSQQPKQSKKSDYKETYNNIDAGIRIGGGFQVYIDKSLSHCLTFDINYDRGMVKTFRNGEPSYDPFSVAFGGYPSFRNAEKIKLTPSKVMIGVGYMFALGKKQSEEKPKRIELSTEE